MFLFKNKFFTIITIIFLLLTSLISTTLAIYFYQNKDENVIKPVTLIDDYSEENNKYVDLKGAVINPGVYKIEDGYIINDILKEAGGLKEDAYTDNINLSMKLSDEMVIYIYTQNEYNSQNIKKESEVCNCDEYKIDKCLSDSSSMIVSSNDANSDITYVNINTASKEELVKLNGIGESKANAIVEYRNKNGNFTNIEDIQNVDGIGKALYEKIKDNIKV